ncbi:MAG: type II toxin-antitoxin system YoeB family toxin [Treponema sp.]|nr:type II toxin-antitoxin system YoeB family toxin [Treponema sp.]
MIVLFTQKSLAEYQSWATEDRKIFKKINDLIKEICTKAFLCFIKAEIKMILCLFCGESFFLCNFKQFVLKK